MTPVVGSAHHVLASSLCDHCCCLICIDVFLGCFFSTTVRCGRDFMGAFKRHLDETSRLSKSCNVCYGKDQQGMSINDRHNICTFPDKKFATPEQAKRRVEEDQDSCHNLPTRFRRPFAPQIVLWSQHVFHTRLLHSEAVLRWELGGERLHHPLVHTRLDAASALKKNADSSLSSRRQAHKCEMDAILLQLQIWKTNSN